MSQNKWFSLCVMTALGLLGIGSNDRANGESEIQVGDFTEYIAKEPFHLLVSKRFPENQSMMLWWNSKNFNKLVFGLNDADDKKGEEFLFRNLSVGVAGVNGVDVQLSIDDNCKPKELSLHLANDTILKDFNLDGSWDIKFVHHEHILDRFIFLDGQWMKVDRIRGLREQKDASIGDQHYSFDMGSGEWRLVDEPKK